MVECRKILAPVDLADFSPRIVPYVRTAVERLGAELHLLYVVSLLREYTAGHVPDIEVTRRFESEALQEARRDLERLAARHFPGCRPATLRVVEGHPADEIVKYVEAEGIDLIVIGTHGRKAIDRLIFGSIAEQVLKHSPVPVLAVKPFGRKAKTPFDFSVEGDEDLAQELEQYKS